MDPPSVGRENDFSISLLDHGKPDEAFARCGRVIQSAYGYGSGDPGLAKWIVHQGAGVPHELHFNSVGRLFFIGFDPNPYDYDRDGYYCLSGENPIPEKYQRNEAAEVHFTGKVADGTVFASSRDHDAPLTFQLIQEDVMPGFTLAVASMQPGERAIFTIPPELAATPSGWPACIPWNIPPNKRLLFDIELISLITDIHNDQGILKKTVKFGRGNASPSADTSGDYDEVFVSYNARLKDGTTVSESEGVEFKLAEGFFCPAFAHALETMTQGEEAVVVIKPQYGFGEQGRPSVGNEAAVPPNATLYVNLQLMYWKVVSTIGESKEILKKTPFERINYAHMVDYTGSADAYKVRLIGRLQDGTVFHRRGYDGEDLFEFSIDEGQVIHGIEEAVMTMKEGDVASFVIPPQHAFGSARNNQNQLASVPPDSTVIYDIELVSIINENYSEMTRDEIIELARTKEEDGDHFFNSGNYLRACKRYLKASLALRSRGEPLDDEIKDMLILFAFKGAECAVQLECYKHASECFREVLRYDPGNTKARKQLPNDSQRVLKNWPWAGPKENISGVKGFSALRLKKNHKPTGRLIFIPPCSAAATGSNSQGTSTTRVVDRGSVATTNGDQTSGPTGHSQGTSATRAVSRGSAATASGNQSSGAAHHGQLGTSTTRAVGRGSIATASGNQSSCTTTTGTAG